MPLPSEIESGGASLLLRAAAERFANKTALIDRDRSITYHELDLAANGLARWFLDQGLNPGDRVAVHWTNALETVELLLGCIHAGLIAVPINTRLKPPEISYILDQCRPRLLFSQPELSAVAKEASQVVPGLPGVHTWLPDWVEGSPLPAPAADTAALILYTSGTTARPKGVVHTHATLAATVRTERFTGIDDSGILIVGVPLMHGSGSVSLTFPVLMRGGTAVLIPVFEPGLMLEAIARHRCNWGMGLPIMMQLLAVEQRRNPRDVSSMRAWLSGGDSVSAKLQTQFQEVFGLPLAEGYAMTESMIISFNPHGANRQGSIGRPAFDVQIEVRGPGGKPLPVGEVGELAVRSPANFIGYWNDPKATASALQNGWLLTGDLGRFDADGYLWFEGRCKNLIIRGGSNISPKEVEETLGQHPAVLECAVVGVPDELLGERVMACLAFRPGAAASESELQEFTRQRLADYKVPERMLPLPRLPRGVTGKLDRLALKELAGAARCSASQLATSPASRQ